MANETKITTIVDEKTLTDLEKLNAKINLIIQTYQNAVKEIGSGLKIKVDGVVDYSDKLQKLTTAMEKVAAGDNALKEAKKEQEILLKRLSEQMKENVKEALEKAKADKIAEQASLAAAKAETERLKQQKLLNQESKKRKFSIEEGVAALNMEVKSLRDADEQNRILRATRKDIDLTTKEGRDTIQRFNSVIDKNTELIKKNSDSLVKSKMNVGRYKEDIKSAASEILKGNVSLKNMGDLAKSTGGYLKTNMGAGLTEVRIGVGSMIKGMVGVQAIIGLVQKAIESFKSGIGTIVDFEAANSKLAAILGTTSKNTKELTSDARRLGAATKYTASEATNLQIELAKLGFSRKEILDSTEYILRFAQATGAELPEAAALAGASLRMFGADTKETERYVSAMAVATVKSALSFSYLQTAMPIVGSVAKTYGFEVEEVLALLGKLADAGIDASSAATATRNIFLNLANGGGKLSEAMGGNIRTLEDFVKGLKKVKDNGTELAGMLEMTDKRSVNAFSNFVAGAGSLLVLKESITSVNGELKAMADTMGDNVEGATKSLSSAWDEFALSFSKSTGPMKSFLNWMADKIRNIAESMKNFEQRTDDIGTTAKSLGERTSATFEIKARVEYNKEYQRLLDAGDSADEASLKAASTISSQKIEIREDELKKLEELKQKALEIGKKADEESSFSWKKFLLGNGLDNGSAKKLEKEATAARKEYMLYQYEISKKEAKNTGINEFLSTKKEKKDADTSNQPPTDKEKAAQEKAAKEQLKIRETYQQSELDLMDEGLNKELAKIAFNYTKKMAAVKGISREEVSTRENLAKEMQQAIEDKTVSYVIAKEQKDIANKLEVVKKGSQEEFDLKVEQLELQRDIETKEAIKTGEDISIIDQKYNAKRRELQEKFSNDKNKKLQEWNAVQSIITEQLMTEELSKLTNEYTKGLISKEVYEASKIKIQQKYAIKAAELAVEVAKLQLGTGNLSEEDTISLKNKLAQAEIALAKLVADANIAEMGRTDDARKKSFKNWEDGLAMIGDALNAFADLGSAIYERKIEEVEGEQEANQEAGDAEIERIDRLAENGVITTEEAEARKRAAAATTAAKETELAKKKADMQTKQAKMDKANAIVQSIINTAIAVMKVWGQTGIGGFALAPIVAALGAVQLATIIAQPIPKYAKGTDNHPGGPAVVGDGGRHEAVVIGSKYFITPDTSTLLDLPSGAKVIPDIEKEMLDLRRISVQSDAMLLYNSKRNDGSRVTVNNDYSDLKKEMQTTNRLLSNMGKKSKRISNYQSFNDFVNRRI